ncbi:hypothetical protein [Streptomyces virginiae]|uniref:hypothetical protein n=1 Tax=Streptomyces virginiae TaxID=1961 RepID=UPI00224D2C5A|nr:hypothetical protein [Streptomyces virginiae]MCX5278275.1 hypothetical protein [Streptomyces virginiae]
MTAVSLEKPFDDLADEQLADPAGTGLGTDPGLAAYVVAQATARAAEIKAGTDAKVREIKAAAEADAIRTAAEAEAERQRIINRRAAMKLQQDEAAHERKIAEQAAATAKAAAEKARTDKAAADQEQAAAEQAAEEQRSETMWRWAARGIYAAGLGLAAPIQFLAFWDPARPFMISAPILLEGLALALAAGAAWAVATRRDVLPFRIGIVIAAMIAATVNVWHGLVDSDIGLNAGVIGGIASLAGPCVLMAYEHGLAQKRDGIPSFRERREAEKRLKAEQAEAGRKAAEKRAADEAKAAEAKARADRERAEQVRQDADRQQHHPDVWAVAEMMRSAQGAAVVDPRIWGAAWRVVHGTDKPGTTADTEALARLATARVKAAREGLLDTDPEGPLAQAGKGLHGIDGDLDGADDEPLSEEQLDAVRELAAELGDAAHLSTGNIRKRLNVRVATAGRLRDAVRTEWATSVGSLT